MRSSMMHGKLGGAALTAAAIFAAMAAPAAADWLVTRGEDGATTQVETRGSWEMKGRLVVFHTADGQLASLRLDQVDLDASREATRKAEEAARRKAEPAVEVPSRERPPRRRITDADIGPGSDVPPPEVGDGDAAGAGAEADGAEPGIPAETLVVIASREDETLDGHTRLSGSLANHGEEPAVGVELTVHLYDREGDLLASAPAELAEVALMAGDVTAFTADFPDVFAYAATRFEPRGTRLATSAPESAPEPGLEDDGGGS